MAKPSIEDQINYIKDLRESISGGIEINILALPQEEQMLKGIEENLLAMRNIDKLEQRIAELRKS